MAASAGGLVLLLLSASVVHGDNGWSVTYTTTEICAVEGATVKMSCSYEYPYWFNNRIISIEKEFWFTRMNDKEYVDLKSDPLYKRRVEYQCSWSSSSSSSCTLTITNVRKSDSGVYRFRFISDHPEGKFTGDPGVTLSVTDDLQVVVLRSSPWPKLQCYSSCRLPDDSSFIWYKNGHKMNINQKEIYRSNSEEDSYSCALGGREDFPSASVCVYGKTCNKVVYTDRSICAVKGSSVDISCTYNSHSGSITSKSWFRSDSSLQWQSPSQPQDLRTGRVQVYETTRSRSTLRISDVTETDSGQYGFTFRTYSFEWGRSLSGATLTVRALQVQVNRVITIQPSYVQAELKCQSSCRPDRSSSYVWFKNGSPTESTTLYYTTWIYPEYNFSCAFKGHEKLHSPIVYAPKTPSLKLSPSGDIVKNSSVTLTCSSDANPAANYTWYQRDSHPQSIHEGPQLVFNSIQSSGHFYCVAENQLGRRRSEFASVDVRYAPDVPSVSVVPSGYILKNSSVTLTCSSVANPAANYTWYQRDSHPESIHKGPQLVFSSIQSSGHFYCVAENQLGRRRSEFVSINVEYAPDVPSVSVVPSGEIVEDSSVTLTCSSDANPAANYTWYKEDEEAPKASGQNFTISDVRAEDGGKYSCEALNSRGRRRSVVVHVTVVTGWMKSAAAGSVSAVLVLVVFLVLFLWIRKKRFFQRTPGRVKVRCANTQLNAGPEYEVPPAASHRNPAEQQDDLFYASISFSKSQDEALYSNVGAAQLKRRSSEEDEDVEYTMVTDQGLRASPQLRRGEAEEDSSALYSTVNKAHRA